MEGIELRLVRDPASPEFARAMEVYENCFPEDERESPDHLARSIASPDGDHVGFLWGILSSGSVKGMAYLSADRVAGTLFFIYVAIEPTWRGRVSAKALMRAITDATLQECQKLAIRVVGLIFEVERVRDAESPSDERLRRKRLSLFVSMGGIVLSQDYIQPALRPEKKPVPLNLMFIPLSDGWDRDRLIVEFYQRVFEIPRDHDYVTRTLNGRWGGEPA